MSDTTHKGEVATIAYSPDSRSIASGGSDGAIRIWELGSGSEKACFLGHDAPVTALSFSPGGRTLVSGSVDKTLRLWDLGATGPARLREPDGRVTAMKFSSDGHQLVTGIEKGTIQIWESRSGTELVRMDDRRSRLTVVEFSPGGDIIAAGSDDGTVVLRGNPSGRVLGSRRDHEGGAVFSMDARSDRVAGARFEARAGVLAIAFSPDGRWIASGGLDRLIWIRGVQDGDGAVCLRGHRGLVNCVAFSPDGSRLVSGSDDRTVGIWDVEGGIGLAQLARHRAPVHKVGYSPDGRRVFSLSSERVVRVWDVGDLSCLERIEPERAMFFTAIVTGGPQYRWWMVPEDWAIQVRSTATGEVVAWLPARFDHASIHPSGRTWAGASGGHLSIFSLEALGR